MEDVDNSISILFFNAFQYTKTKTLCEDLTEGKFSFPIIHGIQNNPGDKQLSSILRQRTTDRELKLHFVSLLEKYGSLAYTKGVLEELELELRKEIAVLGGNENLTALLDQLTK